MWSFASNALAGDVGPKIAHIKASQAVSDCSDDDDVSSPTRGDDGLECPICCESFNIVENVPYVLWCGHTLCKNCVLGLQSAVVKFPTLPVQLPLFITCPWCHLLSFRLVYKGALKFPRKNFFLLWMVERLNDDRMKSHSCSEEQQSGESSNRPLTVGGEAHHHNPRRATRHLHPDNQGLNNENPLANFFNLESIHASIKKSLIFLVQLTAKFPLVIIFLLIILYAIPASATILTLYVLVTILFALPSFLILYFAYPCLDWLVREIIT